MAIFVESVKRKRRQNSNRAGIFAGSLSRAPQLFESKSRNNPYGEPVCRLSINLLVVQTLDLPQVDLMNFRVEFVRPRSGY